MSVIDLLPDRACPGTGGTNRLAVVLLEGNGSSDRQPGKKSQGRKETKRRATG